MIDGLAVSRDIDLAASRCDVPTKHAIHIDLYVTALYTYRDLDI
jgi:hypothetical protein